MNNMKGFILGFSLSILSISLYTPQGNLENKKEIPLNNYKIDLFKEAKATTIPSFDLASIKKETLFTDNTLEDTSTHIDNKELVIAYEEDSNGIEDEEILSINTDDIIPIEINNNHIQNAQINSDNTDEKVAMLPEETPYFDETIETSEESPWIVAKGSKHIDNKILQENNINVSSAITPDETIIKEDLSFEVAKKIKQNIIFPIPDEILNDEDLTPTFINTNNISKDQKKPSKEKQPKLIEKKIVETQNTQPKDNQNTIINNISSWFNKSETKEEETPKRTKATPPIYSTQETKNTNKTTEPQDFGEFYEALQKTKQIHNQKKITPSELKLSFNPERAEISGQTLRWLKAFSEKTDEESCFIQVMLDATTSTELQRKRLNLLYTIFINNNVDLNKVDTVFTNIEPNTFIIRTITLSKPNL